MKRPIRDIPELDGYYVLVLEEYCDLLEQTISALRDDYAELMQNYTDCVKANTELKQTKCSAHPDRIAVFHTSNNPGMFFCEECRDKLKGDS